MALCFVLGLFVLTVAVRANPVQTPARLCVVTNEEYAKCDAMKTNFKQRNLQPQLECVRGADKYDCIIKVEKSEADIIACWSMDTYVAGKYHNLVPLLAEKYSTDRDWTESYRALAVIRKSDDSIHSLEDLKGKKSCHTGVNRHVGWLYPAAALNMRGLLPNNSCINNVPNFGEFFSQSCASNANTKAYDPTGKYKNLCALCGGEGDKFCSPDDPYAGYVGAFKCLVDGRGDVAFVKDSTWAELLKERPQLSENKGDYEILCLDGSRKTIDDNLSCNWGLIPPRALLTTPQQDETRLASLRNLFLDAQKDQNSFKLFESQTYGSKNLIFSDRTVELVSPGQRNDYRKLLGDDYLNVQEKQFPCSVPKAKWCTISPAEYNKCLRMRDAFAARFIKPELECVQAENTEQCLKKLQTCDADLIALDGGDIYTGGRNYGVKPFMFENQGENDAKYYAVAVVNKSNADINYNNLQGKKSCHTGIGRTAGWNIPVGSLLDNNKISYPQDCDIVKATGEFFSQSCAPGALDSQYNPNGTNPSSLCQLCAGVGDDKCSRSNKEPYYGYTGALRCLVEGGGDVAFVKHLTPLENTDGKNTEDWAKNLKKDDFELLCLDGTRKSVDDYKDCNLARVAAHAVSTCGSHDNETIDQYLFLLHAGQQNYGNKTNEANFRLFVSDTGAKDLILDDDTVELKDVSVENREYRNYLGNIAAIFDKLDLEDCQNGTTSPSTTTAQS